MPLTEYYSLHVYSQDPSVPVPLSSSVSVSPSTPCSSHTLSLQAEKGGGEWFKAAFKSYNNNIHVASFYTRFSHEAQSTYSILLSVWVCVYVCVCVSRYVCEFGC